MRLHQQLRSKTVHLHRWQRAVRLLLVGMLTGAALLACGDESDPSNIEVLNEPLLVDPDLPVDVGGVSIDFEGFVVTTGSRLEAGYATLVHEATGLDGELLVVEGSVADLLAEMVAPHELPGGSEAQPVRVPVPAGNTYLSQYRSPGGRVLMAIGRAAAGRYMVLTLYNIEGVTQAEGEQLGREAGTAVSTAIFPAAP